MFLYLSVILFTGGVYPLLADPHTPWTDTPPRAGLPPTETPWQTPRPPPGLTQPWQTPVPPREDPLLHRPPTPEMATAVDGTHPTGMHSCCQIRWIRPVVDPGFPRGWGANFPGGRQHTILPNVPKNCMKLKEFRPRGGTHPSRPP